MYVSNTNKITKHHEQGGRDLIGGVYTRVSQKLHLGPSIGGKQYDYGYGSTDLMVLLLVRRPCGPLVAPLVQSGTVRVRVP